MSIGIDFDKLDRALEKLERLARYMEDPKYRKKRLRARKMLKYREEKKRELQRLKLQRRRSKPPLVEEELSPEAIEEKIKRYEASGTGQVNCVVCGTPFEVDLKYLAYLARLYGNVDPDTFAVCPICRMNKKCVSSIKRKMKKLRSF